MAQSYTTATTTNNIKNLNSSCTNNVKTCNTSGNINLMQRLKFVKEIAEGGQAKVELHRHVLTKQVFVLKKGPLSLKDPLIWEARLLAQLHSSKVPGVVPFKGILTDNTYKYLLLGYCDRGSLVNLLEKKPHQRLPEVEARRVLSSLLQTLKGCHAMGIMHRDIKLENVFLRSSTEPSHTDQYDVFLGDFGLATRFGKAKQLGFHDYQGTLEYMAPELLHGSYDERADIWSLGVLLHCLLTAYLPFSDENDDALKTKIVYEKLDIMQLKSAASRIYYSHLSNAARDLLERMLDRNPGSRITLEAILKHPWLNNTNLNACAERAAPTAVKKTCNYNNSTVITSNPVTYDPPASTNLKRMREETVMQSSSSPAAKAETPSVKRLRLKLAGRVYLFGC